MWFDPMPKLAEITAQAPALVAVSQVSQSRMAREPTPRVASVAVVATPLQSKPEVFPYGTACNMGDAPRTWTGRIVSLDEWRRLTEWEKHGPNGRLWYGITRQWEQTERGGYPFNQKTQGRDATAEGHFWSEKI